MVCEVWSCAGRGYYRIIKADHAITVCRKCKEELVTLHDWRLVPMRPRQYIDDIEDFHQAFGAFIGDPPHTVPPVERKALRISLMIEELNELIEAIEEDDVVGVAKECADLVVVALGTAVEYGLDFDAVWREVHQSNMAKLGGPVREDGKILKPEGWQPPDIESIVRPPETA